MKTIKLASASRSLAEYAKELDDQIVVVTDRNKPVAAVVPLRNVDIGRIERLAGSLPPGTSCSGLGRASSGRVIVELADVATGPSAH